MEHSSTSQTFELNDLQLQLWHMHLLSPDPAALTLAVRYHLEAIDPARWCEAFSRVVDGEPILALHLTGHSDNPVLERRRLDPPPILYEDYAAKPRAELDRIVEERGRLGLDPREGLLASLLVHEGGDHYSWFLNLHHIITDGWSLKVIVDRTLSVYQGNDGSEDAVGAGDYAAELIDNANSPEFEADRRYWDTKLATPFVPTNFYDLINGHSGRIHRLRSTLECGLTARIGERALELGGVSRNRALAAFFASILVLFLHKMTGQRYLSLGVPYAHRRSQASRKAVGLFMRVGVFRISLSPQESFSSLFARLLDEGKETAHHLRYPLVNRGNRLYDVMLNVHNVSYASIDGHPIREEWLHSANDSLPFTLHVRTSVPDRLVLELDLQEGLFPQGSGERILDQLRSLSEQAVEDPHSPVTRFLLEPVAPLEFRLPVRSHDSPPRRLEALFEAVVPSVSSATAIYSGEDTISFAGLDARANEIASELSARGCRPGSIVAVHLRRSIGAVASILGILKCGAVWLPLDPDYPAELLQFMLNDAAVALGIREGEGTADRGARTWIRVAARTGHVLASRSSEERAAAGGKLPDRDRREVTPRSPAYCFYTSGSTGRAKGILGTHEGALNRLEWMWREYPLEPGEVLLQKTSLDFVDSVWEIFGALLSGHALVIADTRQVRDPLMLAALVTEYPIARIILVPTLLRSFMESPGGFPGGLLGISHWFLTGELLTSETAKRLLALHPEAELYNLYGTTESYDAACTRVGGADLEYRFAPIGRAIDNFELRVLDEERNPVPPGIRGELYISGIGVAAGYLNRPELTAAKFLTVSDEPRTLFRTGDAARILPDGRVQCLGRLDNMVKVAGYRVELEAVEAVLRSFPAVNEAIALAEIGDKEETLLTAFVTCVPGEPPDATELRRGLRKRLPPWMVPKITIVGELRHTPSGKLLREPPTTVGAEEVGSEPVGGAEPENPYERRLVEIWRSLLGAAMVGCREDFFEIGGTSLLALRLTSAIEREFEIRLPLSVVFEAPTVRGLAARIAHSNASAGASPVAVRIGSPAKIPLFSVPPAGSTVSAFGLLARSLPEDQSLYSFQPRGIEPGERPHLSIEEMAHAYVAEMKQVQPEGPYIVSGRCFGGYVAYEMAQQLIEAGDRVAALIIIDSPEAPLVEEQQRSHVGVRKLLSYYPERMRYFLKRGMLTYTLRMKLRNEASYAIERILARLPVSTRDSRERRLKMLRHIHTLAYHRYVAKPFPGRITLFWADGLPDITGEKEKWKKLARKGVEWYTFTSRHHDLLKEHNVRPVAEQLAECIERAQE